MEFQYGLRDPNRMKTPKKYTIATLSRRIWTIFCLIDIERQANRGIRLTHSNLVVLSVHWNLTKSPLKVQSLSALTRHRFVQLSSAFLQCPLNNLLGSCTWIDVKQLHYRSHRWLNQAHAVEGPFTTTFDIYRLRYTTILRYQSNFPSHRFFPVM